MNKLKRFLPVSLMTVAVFFSQAYNSLAAPLLGIPKVSQSTAPDLVSAIAAVGGWILTLAGAIAVLMLIYGGITYMTGGEEGAKKGKGIIVNAIIGIAVIALATIIVTFVVNALA